MDEKVLDNITFTLNREDESSLVGGNEQAKTTLFQILTGDEWSRMKVLINGALPHPRPTSRWTAEKNLKMSIPS